MQLKGAAILVVDDEPALQKIFADWVRREGATVYSASNGAEALEVAQAHHIDLVLSDVRMPVMDGIALAKRLKEVERYTIKVIFVSGFADLSDREAFDLGVEEFLHKPIRRKPLIAKLQQCLADREELWSEPHDIPAEQTLRQKFPSLSDALERHMIGFGRGGFCMRIDQPVQDDMELNLDLEFEADAHALRGQGVVRWTSNGEGLCGIELLYLDQADRRWVLELTRENSSRSFIPARPVSAQ
ncbi:response regulator [Emcibacter sp. SYSU 3D8]|uniref:response regulator n=1 Tax=Emcibacter sp. SYSU 3D8 TaxID=3133969 RepID=UPI0031FF46BF